MNKNAKKVKKCSYLDRKTQNEVIKIVDMEDEPNEYSTFISCENTAFNKKENPVSEKPSELRKRFTCNDCEKVFPYQSSFNTHMFTHSGHKAFSCDMCEKAFAKESNLNTHMLTHSGKKAFS